MDEEEKKDKLDSKCKFDTKTAEELDKEIAERLQQELYQEAEFAQKDNGVIPAEDVMPIAPPKEYEMLKLDSPDPHHPRHPVTKDTGKPKINPIHSGQHNPKEYINLNNANRVKKPSKKKAAVAPEAKTTLEHKRELKQVARDQVSILIHLIDNSCLQIRTI